MKFLVTLDDIRHRFYFGNISVFVEAESEQEAAKKLGVDYDKDDKAFLVDGEDEDFWVLFKEIKEVSTPEQFMKVVKSEEARCCEMT